MKGIYILHQGIYSIVQLTYLLIPFIWTYTVYKLCKLYAIILNEIYRSFHSVSSLRWFECSWIRLETVYISCLLFIAIHFWISPKRKHVTSFIVSLYNFIWKKIGNSYTSIGIKRVAKHWKQTSGYTLLGNEPIAMLSLPSDVISSAVSR